VVFVSLPGLVWFGLIWCVEWITLLDAVFLPVCMLTKLPQMKTLLLSRSPVMM
jgi:hypothetical protein